MRNLLADDSAGVARGVVLFIGDGMGMSSVTAARIMKGAAKGTKPEGYRLQWDRFPYVGLAKVSSTDCLAQSLGCGLINRLIYFKSNFLNQLKGGYQAIFLGVEYRFYKWL